MINFRILLAVTLTLIGSAFAAEQGASAQKLPYSFKPIASAKTAPDEQGFIPRWLILEPITIGNQQTENASKAAVKTEYFPNQLTILPHDGDKETVSANELT